MIVADGKSQMRHDNSFTYIQFYLYKMGKQPQKKSLKEQANIKWNLISTKPFPEKQNLIKQLITEHIQTLQNQNSLFCCLNTLCDILNPNYNTRESSVTLSYFKDFLTERTKMIIMKIQKYLGLFQKFHFEYQKRENQSFTTVSNQHQIRDHPRLNFAGSENERLNVQINKLKSELQNFEKQKENAIASIRIVKEQNESLRNENNLLLNDNQKLSNQIKLMQASSYNLREELKVMKGNEIFLREQLRTVKELQVQRQTCQRGISTGSQTQYIKNEKPQKAHKLEITSIKSIAETLIIQKQNEKPPIIATSQSEIQLNQFIEQHPQICFLMSSILPCLPLKQQSSIEILKTQKLIISEIQNYYNGTICRRRRVVSLKYLYGLQKMKLTMLNFHNFVDNRPFLLMIIKIKNSQEVIGVYSEAGLLESENQNAKTKKGSGFILNAHTQQVFIPKQKFSDSHIFPYDPFFIIVGNQDLKIKMFSEKLQSFFGFQYSMFKSERKTECLFVSQKQNEVEVEDYEFYEIVFN